MIHIYYYMLLELRKWEGVFDTHIQKCLYFNYRIGNATTLEDFKE